MKNQATPLAWPYLGGLLLLVGLPAAAAVVLSLTEFTGLTPPVFVGLDNFVKMLGDAAFWRALGNSGIYVAIAVPLRVAGAVAAALLLHRRARGIGAARAAVYLPTVVPDVAYALLWLWLLNPIYGPIAAALQGAGAGTPGFLTDPWATRVAIAVMSAFQIGEGFVIALAMRRSIPERLYEAAEVDGARPSFVLRRVTLPLMTPLIALLALRDLIFTFQANFVPALIVTDGGPRYATTYLALFVYRTAFRYFRLGYASALTMAMFVITAIVIFIQYRLARRWRLL